MPEKSGNHPGVDDSANQKSTERKAKGSQPTRRGKTSARPAAPERRLSQIVRLLKHVGPGGELEAFSSPQEWERLVDSNPPELRNLLRELARFADLWRYFQKREEKLGAEIVGEVGRLHRLNLAARVVQLKKINRRLMQRVNDGGKGTQSRH